MTENDNDPWADVFARAEGSSSVVAAVSLNSNEPSDNSNNDLTGSKKRKRKKRSSSSNSGTTSTEWNQHLKNRIKYTSLVEQHESVILLGKSLLSDTECAGWKLDRSNKNNNDKVPSSKLCSTCGHGSFSHVCETAALFKSSNNSNNDHWRIRFFCLLRNVRCLAVLSILKNTTTTTPRATLWKEFQSGLQAMYRNSFQPQHGQTWNTLEEPWNDLMQKLQSTSRLEHRKKHRSSSHEQWLESIMLCDACYYEIYYADLTHNVSNPSSAPQYIPHPTAYFGEALESGDLVQATNTVLDSIGSAAQSHYHWSNQTCSKGGKDSEEDALTALRRTRFLESVAFFQNVELQKVEQGQDQWLSLIPTQGKPGSSPLDVHETPAPKLLRKWRDSCRDFVTHLYGYAVVPPLGIHKIVEFTKGTNILELGAGTGYLAHLLKQKGASVRALDVAPTSLVGAKATPHPGNEYHAATPAFTNVEQGSVQNVNLILKAKASQNRSSKFTLLLAYPPPDSKMGYLAVKTFFESGGTELVHIGEFNGLTGTRELERFLAKHGRQVDSIPCPTWGTDAANITFWSLAAAQGRPSESTLHSWSRCIQCESKPGSKRFRMLRHLELCSQGCWKKYRQSEALQDQLKCSSLQRFVNVESLDFDNPSHFFDLTKR